MITGAGSGIGRALALNLAGRGSLLALSDVDEAGLAETAERARAAGAREVRTDRVDVADRDAMSRYALDVVQQFGRVNVVINNAGVSLTGDFTDLEFDDIDWIVGVNFWGVVHGTKEFLPHLIASGDGHVVNLSSLFGLVSIPGQTMYNATKYAVRGMSEAIREEMLVAGHPVGVTSVHPGGIKTDIVRNSRVSAKEDKAATAELFDKRLAQDERRAGRRDHRRRHPEEPGPRAGRPRRARHPPHGQAARLALPGRRRGRLEAGRAAEGHPARVVVPTGQHPPRTARKHRDVVACLLGR